MIRVFRWVAVLGCLAAVSDIIIETSHAVTVYVETGSPESGRGIRGFARILSGCLTRPLILFVMSGLLYVACEITNRLPPHDPAER